MGDFGEGGFRADFFAFFFHFGFGFEASEAFFEGDGDGDYWVAFGVLLDPFGDFGEVLVLLPDVVLFAEIDEVDDWFGCE